MKRFIFPLSAALLAFIISFLCQSNTLVFQEYEGLFLTTPDYFSWLWNQPFPISQLISDFITQFFRFSVTGPFAVAGMVLLASLLGKGIWPGLGTIAAGSAEWLVLAFSATIKPGIILLWGLFILWLLFRLFHIRIPELPGKWNIGLNSCLLLATALCVAFHPAVVKKECWSRVKRDIVNSRWDDVLKTATQKVTEKDRELLPFALLAMGEKQQLGEKMFSYPVTEENDFDMCLEEDYANSLFYRAFLYHRLCCYSESCHELFQLATQQAHGTSALVLRQLVTEYYLLGDYGLAEKYCRILETSTTHKAFVKSFRKFMEEGEPAPKDTPEERGTIDLITKNPSYNLMLLQDNGIVGTSTQDRLYATLLLQRRLDVFGAFVQKRLARESYYPPVHYLEAMQILFEENPSFSRFEFPMIAPQQMKRFNDFMDGLGVRTPEQQREKYGNTYWFYYYYLDGESTR